MARVGEKIKRLRENRGWTQPHLAVEAGVAVSAVSQIENGRRSPNVGTLDKLARAFGVEVVDLFQEPEVPKVPARSSTEPPERSEGERLLTRLCCRLIEDLEADANRWEETARTGGIGLAGYPEIVARRLSVQNSLNALGDVSEALGVDFSDRRGHPLRWVRRDLQSAYNRWSAARMELIEIYFNSLTGTQLVEARARQEDEEERIEERTRGPAKWFDVG